ncbi:DNA repair helicase XPB [Paenibacillus tuaregi]|uniref:DNA repair helicase XPB n=1 Tax=Paenibacillus tuaregi TaxID=1816681 RepID=UPI000837DED4|nr:DNA repair helicase XPB [Paenibacillus tuaregi]
MEGTGACIVQRDFTVLLEKDHPGFEAARLELSRYAELLKSPASFHTYRLTPLSLWNAAASGMTKAGIMESLSALSRFKVPDQVHQSMDVWLTRYGKLRLRRNPDDITTLILQSDPEYMDEIRKYPSIRGLLMEFTGGGNGSCLLAARHRGVVKQELTRLGYPVLDEVGYHHGNDLRFSLRTRTTGEDGFTLRSYQRESVDAFAGKGEEPDGGSGVLVLPCGAGKTVIGLAAMERLQCETLILTSNVTSVRQWIHELRSKSTLLEEQIGEYSGDKKEVRPVTVSTYQILTHRSRKEVTFKHMKLFNERDWGLIIYDEVHLLPAPVFRVTADIQATRRLGLTATLIREDGCEKDVFSLIGPKRYEMPWRELEQAGWIAEVKCTEIRISLPEPLRKQYLLAEGKRKYRLAAENPAKLAITKRLLQRHAGKPALIIGQYLDQLTQIAAELEAPLITGRSGQQERIDLYQGFQRGDIPVLVVSKVANFAVDLPDAAVGIQVSGSYGSRQEEAQRLGRLLRPKAGDNRAFFYTLVSDESKELAFALRRQLFLIEQGYEYTVREYSEDDFAGKEADWASCIQM